MATIKAGFATLCSLLLSGAIAAAACSSPAAKAQHFSAGCAGARQIALTFDDGPNPPYTERILALLAASGAHATFFDEGEQVEAHPDTVSEELSAGMAVGAHSYAHSPDLPKWSASEFGADLQHAEEAIQHSAGFTPELYRSPYGHTSDTMLRELRQRGYVSIGWDIDSRDWSDATVDEVVQNVLTQAHPGGIVLMHDGGLGGGNPDRTVTIAALPRILDGLRADGYALVTIPELTGASEAQGAQIGNARHSPQVAKCSAN